MFGIDTELDIQLSTIKSKPIEDILSFINEAMNHPQKAEVVKYFRTQNKNWGFEEPQDDDYLYREIILTLILADVGNQASPFIRESNIEKMKEIANKHGINFPKLVRLTAYL